jgi:hypothetical protein
MKNTGKVRRAALAALAAVALMAAAGPASAAIYRIGWQGLERFPDTRARLVDDGSVGLGMKLRLLFISRWRVPAEETPGVRMPARRERKG